MAIFDPAIFDPAIFDAEVAGVDGNASGATISTTASLIAGATAAGAGASGATMSAAASVIAGAAIGASSAAGATLPTTASLLEGTAEGEVGDHDGDATGAILAASASLIAGAADNGEIIAEPPVEQPFVSGGRFGRFGHFFPERIVEHAEARGELLGVRVELLPGRASAQRYARVAQRALVRRVSLIGGSASGGAQTPVTVFLSRGTLTPGEAKGFDAVKHDNDFLLMAA